MEDIFKPKDLPMESVPNKTLLKNSEAELSPTVEIQKYFGSMDPRYLKQLESFNTKIEEPMQKETRAVICIPVAGYQEASTIYKTLESYAEQKVNLKEFEVLLLVNSPEKARTERKSDIEKTMSEIERAKKEFPHLHTRVVQIFLDQNEVRIGNLRKLVTDLALLRQNSAGIDRDLLLLSNDADNQGISPEYIDSYLKYFKEHLEKEGAVGNLQFDPKAFIRFPTIAMEQELVTFLDQTGFQNGNIMLFGNNSCMKSSIYASIGGYPPGLKTGEQNWTGDTIRKLRKKKSTLGFVKDGLLTTSSRRGVITHLLGLEKQVAFSDTSTEEAMRSLDIESSPIFDYTDKETLARLRLELEKTINTIIDIYETGEKLGKDSYYYRGNLKKVGIEYEVDENGIIKITNMDRFIERQEVMQGMIKNGEKNMAKVIEASWKV